MNNTKAQEQKNINSKTADTAGKKSKMNRRIASLLLVFSAFGSFVLYPFHNSLIGGLFASGFIASLVGGCADWFAVNALFRKPLGIPFKTEILIKNRDKLFNALSDMVENELITKENILQKAAKLDFSAMLLESFAKEERKASVKALIERFITDILASLDAKKTAAHLYRVVREDFSDFRFSPLLAKGIVISVENGYDEKVLALILHIAKKAVENEQISDLILQIIHETRVRYEGNRLRRKLTNSLLLSDLTDEKLLQHLKDWLDGFETDCHRSDCPARQRLRAFLLQKAKELESGGAVADAVEKAKENWLRGSPSVQAFCKSITERFSEYRNNPKNSAHKQNILGARLADSIMDIAVKRLDVFDKSKEQQAAFNAFVVKKIAGAVDINHAKIGKLVRDNLSKYSGTELAAMIEDKAGDDLQIIRINGSIVGGLAGMLLYLLTAWMH